MNLATEYGCSNPLFLRLTFSSIFLKFYQNLDFKKFQNFEFLNPLVRNSEGFFSEVAVFASKYDCSNPSSF